jgi:S-DNA-T family DNA segregation ATPase FtsK/SpoIIIE
MKKSFKPDVIPPPQHPLMSTGLVWRVPPAAGILDRGPEPLPAPGEIRRLREAIERAFGWFNLPVKVVETIPGPWINQFYIEALPGEAQGFLGRFRKRQPELWKTLRQETGESLLRIQTPEARRARLCVQVLNPQLPPIQLRWVMTSQAFQQAQGRLKIPLGVDLAGQPASADLASLPHLLVAGITGGGKSVFVHSLLASLLCQYSSEDLRFLLIDHEIIELHFYQGIPHLAGMVLGEGRDTLSCLGWVEEEVRQRLALLQARLTANLEAYNASSSPEVGRRLPYLVVVMEHVFDHLEADPYLAGLLARILPQAPLAGVHFVVTDSGPSARSMTTAVLNWLPARACFYVNNTQSSRQAIGQPGAEYLLGHGDFLFRAGPDQPVQRLHACLLADREFNRLLHFWEDQARVP